MTGPKRDKLGPIEDYRSFICVLLKNVKSETLKTVQPSRDFDIQEIFTFIVILMLSFWYSQFKRTEHQTAARYQKAPKTCLETYQCISPAIEKEKKAKNQVFNTQSTLGGRCVNVSYLYSRLFSKGGMLNVVILKNESYHLQLIFSSSI